MAQSTELGQLLEKVFENCRDDLRKTLDAATFDQRKRDYVFHMTDWLDDLHTLAQLYQNPEKQDLEAATTAMIGFLYHVVPHLNAAGRLLLDEIVDPFEERHKKVVPKGIKVHHRERRKVKAKTN